MPTQLQFLSPFYCLLLTRYLRLFFGSHCCGAKICTSHFFLTRDYSKYCFCSLTEILLLNFGPPNFFQSIFVFFYVAQKSVFRSTCSYIVKIFGYILECKNIGQQKMSRLFAFYLFSMGNFG